MCYAYLDLQYFSVYNAPLSQWDVIHAKIWYFIQNFIVWSTETCLRAVWVMPPRNKNLFLKSFFEDNFQQIKQNLLYLVHNKRFVQNI